MYDVRDCLDLVGMVGRIKERETVVFVDAIAGARIATSFGATVGERAFYTPMRGR
jgi:hypothetical protein